MEVTKLINNENANSSNSVEALDALLRVTRLFLVIFSFFISDKYKRGGTAKVLAIVNVI